MLKSLNKTFIGLSMAALTFSACQKSATTDVEPAAEAKTDTTAEAKAIKVGVVAADAKTADAKTEVEVPVVDVLQLTAMLESKDCTAVDANGETTRKKFGVIPGAVKLTSFDKYAASELPSNKDAKLVFYCSSSQCTSAPAAAKKAMAAGYSNVSQLKVGIKGWVEAGKKVDSI